jgi:hypothetical protein
MLYGWPKKWRLFASSGGNIPLAEPFVDDGKHV